MTTKRAATCHPERPYYSRWLCHDCYDHHYLAKTLHQFPTRTTPLTTVITTHNELTTQGKTPHQIAEHLGMNYPAYTAALRRARTKGLL